VKTLEKEWLREFRHCQYYPEKLVTSKEVPLILRWTSLERSHISLEDRNNTLSVLLKN